MEGDAVYFGRRARQERDLAERAQHPQARRAHEELARRYEEFASAIAAHQGRHGVNEADDPLRAA